MIYYLLIIAIMLSPFPSKAEEEICSLKDLGFGKNFSELHKKYNLNKEFRGNKKYTKNIRGRDVCAQLGNAEVEMLFINDELVQIIIFDKAPDINVLTIAMNNFGKPRELPNEQGNQSNFSTLWDLGDSVATYTSYSLKGKLAEKLMVQYKNAAADIARVHSRGEDNSPESNDNESEAEQ